MKTEELIEKCQNNVSEIIFKTGSPSCNMYGKIVYGEVSEEITALKSYNLNGVTFQTPVKVGVKIVIRPGTKLRFKISDELENMLKEVGFLTEDVEDIKILQPQRTSFRPSGGVDTWKY